MKHTIVVGAGLSGLLAGLGLSRTRRVTVFDKARGVGGRLATRRTERAKFDHGAQFYRLKEPLRELHERWLARGLVRRWFTDSGVERCCATEGMTALAKDLARDLEVVLNERVTGLRRVGAQWQLSFESGRSEAAEEVILTSPLPQSLSLLEASSIAYPRLLREVSYTKALVILFEESPRRFRFSSHGYLELEDNSIFSVADQSDKGISRVPALTVTLGAAASDSHFEAEDDAVVRFAVDELRKLSPGFEPGAAQVKRWRYVQVVKPFADLYVEAAGNLFLIGDGFGGASLNGAARSATALLNHLDSAIEPKDH